MWSALAIDQAIASSATGLESTGGMVPGRLGV